MIEVNLSRNLACFNEVVFSNASNYYFFMDMTHMSDIHQLFKLVCFNSGAQVIQSLK